MKSRTAVSTPGGVDLLVFTMEPDTAEITILARQDLKKNAAINDRLWPFCDCQRILAEGQEATLRKHSAGYFSVQFGL